MTSTRLIPLAVVAIALSLGTSYALENARQVPARDMPVPTDTVSPDMAKVTVAALKMIVRPAVVTVATIAD